jgi:hypothetical protein
MSAAMKVVMEGIIVRRGTTSKRAYKKLAANVHGHDLAKRQTSTPAEFRRRLLSSGVIPTELTDWYGTLWLGIKDEDGYGLGGVPISSAEAAEFGDLNLPRIKHLPHRRH